MRLITVLTIATATCLSLLAAPADPKPVSSKPVPITLTLGDIVNSQAALSTLFSFKLPVRVSWPLGDTVSAVESKLDRYNTERARIIKAHNGVLDPKTNLITFPPAEVEGVNADLKTLADLKVELTITPIPLSLLPDSVSLSASDMARLKPFLINDLSPTSAPAPAPALAPKEK